VKEFGETPASAPLRGVWLRFGVLVALLLTALAVAVRVGVPDPQELRSIVAQTGATGILLFIAGYVVCTLLVLPKGVLSIGAGIAFGFLPGAAIVMVGAILGASAAFVVGRWLGRDAVERMAGAHLARLDALVTRYGFAAIVLVRLIPLAPFTVINYAAGLTSIGFRSYAVATAVGIIPGTLAYVALGAFGTSPTSWEFLVAILVFAALTVGGVLVARRHRAVTPVIEQTTGEVGA
jgi:uncharacterized membrane protein YdjX (TVP38/TMEM64 family)